MKRVMLRIEHLVLKGFRQSDRHAVAQGLQQQLTRVLSAPGAAQRFHHGGDVSCLRLGNLNVSFNAKPLEVGAATANRIGKGLGL
jgi:hypothetical protein